MQNGTRTVVFATLTILSLGLSLRAQVDLDAAARELDRMFERPAGTVISAEQKASLDEFLARYEGKDLGHLGYAVALGCYFRRDAAGGAKALDEFFAHHDHIANVEHATMAGRIYIAATMEQLRGRSPDMEKLCRWGERMAALYLDLGTVGRVALQILDTVDEPTAFRMSLVRGVARSSAADAEKDEFLTTIYAPRKRLPPPASDTVPTAGQQLGAVGAVGAVGAAQGDAVPKKAEADADQGPLSIPVLAAVGGGKDFALTDLRGKIVVIDLLASWCPPCRSAIQPLHTLVKAYGDKVAMVAVTRFYGRGMDFGPDAALPHGGNTVNELDKAAEIALYERFAKAFSVQHPIVFTSNEAWQHRLNVEAIPTTLVVGADGQLVGRVMGANDDARRRVRALLDQALKGQ